MSPSRAIYKLTDVHHAASDIASDQVRVHALQVGRRKNPPRQNAIAETGSNTLNLTNNAMIVHNGNLSTIAGELKAGFEKNTHFKLSNLDVTAQDSIASALSKGLGLLDAPDALQGAGSALNLTA